MKHSDILSAASVISSNLSSTLIPTHVKGHQDSETPFENLDRKSQVNVLMDDLAKKELKRLEEMEEIRQWEPHPDSFPQITINGKTIHDRVTEKTYEEIASDKLIKYWISKGRLENKDKDKIDWGSNKKDMQLSPLHKRIFMSKWASNFSPTGKNMKRWRLRPHGNCPYL